MAGMKTIISLAFLLAIGILFVILSCAQYGSWLPLLVILVFVLAPLPNLICGRVDGGGDIWSDGGDRRGIAETGTFITSFLVISGFGIPMVLAHAGKIQEMAMAMSVTGGLMVYGTILGYMHFFGRAEDPYF
ncbi:vacuolar protein sorting 55 [Phlyctochytrium arcticum]|nr:vacuolar protein sorting 55 [Phlyctochytrium arcticum]